MNLKKAATCQFYCKTAADVFDVEQAIKGHGKNIIHMSKSTYHDDGVITLMFKSQRTLDKFKKACKKAGYDWAE